VRCAHISCLLVELALWFCAHEQRTVGSLKTNKEQKEEVGGRSPTLG
jgi:hypothetical protein